MNIMKMIKYKCLNSSEFRPPNVENLALNRKFSFEPLNLSRRFFFFILFNGLIWSLFREVLKYQEVIKNEGVFNMKGQATPYLMFNGRKGGCNNFGPLFSFSTCYKFR